MSVEFTNNYPVDKVLTFAVEHAKELLTDERRRENSLLSQANNMQTAFAIIIAALFVVAQIVFEYSQNISVTYLTVIFSTIGAVLLFGLFTATMVQNRRRQSMHPKIEDFNRQLQKEFRLFEKEAQRASYVLKAYIEIQESLYRNNNKRVTWIRISMYTFYLAILLCVVFFYTTILINSFGGINYV